MRCNPVSDSKPIVYVVQHNHFDPIWRRCWDRPFDYKGRRYQPYAAIEEAVFNIWLENARKGAVCSEGQAVVFRKYLERNPERLDEIRELVRQDKIEITAAGETVADTNMPSGETLLRNLAMGQWWFEKTFGVTPTLGWIEDAFGQSAQLPQIFRGCECNHIVKFSYTRIPQQYWRGLDGTVIFKAEVPTASAGHCIKAPPCEACSGVGCDECGGLGMDADAVQVNDEKLQACLGRAYSTETISMLSVGGEEAWPRKDLVERVEEARKAGNTDLRYGGYGEISKFYAELIAKQDDPGIEAWDGEANCASTGCYVSRIKIKQEFRRIENLVNAAERWATVSWLHDGKYPTECLTEAWRNLLFVAFHDAITSTHIDAAYYELMEMLDTTEHEAGHVFESALGHIESKIAVPEDKNLLLLYNSECWERSDAITISFSETVGQPALRDVDGNEIPVLDSGLEGDTVHFTFRAPAIPALGYAAVEFVPDAAPVDAGEVTSGPGTIENEFFAVTASDKGVASIVDKRTGGEVIDASEYLANELILEEDIGHPWGTMKPASTREKLSAYTTDVSIRRAKGLSVIRITGQYKGGDPNVKVLSWRQWITLYEAIDRIDFRTQIDWDTAQRRIRVAFPTLIKKDEATYAIPYGAVERGSYEPDMTKLPSTNGDWPAINWVDVCDAEQDRGVALVNTGTPSHKVKDGVIFLSLLRSPTDSWCLNEPEYYDCPDFDGARDAGTHEFTYSLIPHQGDYRSAGIEKRAREINNPIMVRMLEEPGDGGLGLTHSFIDLNASDNVIVTTIKKAEKGDAAIVRLAETAGQSGQAQVSLEGASGKQHLVNFLERQAKPVKEPIEVRPFKIMTVRIEK
jgi:alpha-mannosidase